MPVGYRNARNSGIEVKKNMTIRIGGREFEGPYNIEQWDPPRKAAVYSVMTRQGRAGGQASYVPVYFGQSENLDERGFIRDHHKFGCWIREAGSTNNLFIAYRAMPQSTESDRRQFEDLLISKYTPVCND